MGKTQSKALAERHGRGKAWERHGMCESALNLPQPSGPQSPAMGMLTGNVHEPHAV
jgi:hypothetical protein